MIQEKQTRRVVQGLGLMLMSITIGFGWICLALFLPIVLSLGSQSKFVVDWAPRLIQLDMLLLRGLVPLILSVTILGAIGTVLCLATPRDVGASKWLFGILVSLVVSLAAPVLPRLGLGFVSQTVLGAIQLAASTGWLVCLLLYLRQFARFLGRGDIVKICNGSGLFGILTILCFAGQLAAPWVLSTLMRSGGLPPIAGLLSAVPSIGALLFGVLAYMRGIRAMVCLRRELKSQLASLR